MHKLFSIFLLLGFLSIINGQPVVDIPLSGSDGSLTIAMAVGLDPAATNGIDPGLGESDLPPFPPAGAFEIRFDLTPYAGEPLSTYKDYRFAAALPYTGTVEHKLIYQTSTPGLPIDIVYNLPGGASLSLVDPIGGGFLNLGPFTGSGTATIPGTYTAIFNNCFLNMAYDAVPVELTSFSGDVRGDGVLLNWSTATELNNQGFDIERSRVSEEWSKIGYVPGNGTTTEQHTYSFLDNNVNSGIYYYRLKQIDFSGQFAYSNEIEVDLTPQNFELFQNYPNPFNPTTTIQFQVPEASDVSIVIYDMLGQKVKALFSENVQSGNYSVNWNGINDSGTKMSSGT